MKIKIKLVFFRTLLSQSAASLTMSRLAAVVRAAGLSADLCLMERDNLHSLDSVLDGLGDYNILVAKPNFKDFDRLLPLLAGLKKSGAFQRVYLCGPFAVLNAASLKRGNNWLDGIIDYPVEANLLRIIQLWRRSSGLKLRIESPLLQRAAAGQSVAFADLPRPARDIEAREGGRYANLEYSWGCDYRCSFCHWPLLKNKSGDFAGVRPTEAVVQEMIYLQRELGKSFFVFNDSCFWRSAADDRRIRSFCSLIRRRGVKAHLYIYLRCRPFIGEANIKRLAAAGLVRVFVGLESFAGNDQKIYNKIIKENNFDSLRRVLEKYGINIHIGFIVFSPYSGLKDVALNIKYLDTIGHLFRIGVILEPVRVIPGSALQQRLVADGLMADSLGYKDVTYGYRFKNRAAGECLKFIKATFAAEDLRALAYEFEYFCTTMGLIDSLLLRSGRQNLKLISADRQDFMAARRRGELALKKYLLYVIGRFERGAKVDPQRTEEFKRNFAAADLSLKIKYSLIKARISRSEARSLLAEVYSGAENL